MEKSLGTELAARPIAWEQKRGVRLRCDSSQFPLRVWQVFLPPLLLSPFSVDIAQIIEVKRLQILVFEFLACALQDFPTIFYYADSVGDLSDAEYVVRRDQYRFTLAAQLIKCFHQLFARLWIKPRSGLVEQYRRCISYHGYRDTNLLPHAFREESLLLLESILLQTYF